MLPVLVIDNDDLPVYEVCRYIWRLNVSNHKNYVKLFFLRSSVDISIDEVKVDGEFIYVNKADSPNVEIISKTLAAIRHCLENFNFEFILRTNLSSFYSINNLIESLKNLPKTLLYAGYPGIFQNGKELITFCSGSGFLISKDICQLLEARKQPDLTELLPDDVWIGKVLEDIPRTNMPRMDFCGHTGLSIELIKMLNGLRERGELDKEIQFRVKCINELERINVDSFILFFLYNYFKISSNKLSMNT